MARIVAFAVGLALCAMAVAQLPPNNAVWSSEGCVERVPGMPERLTAIAKSQTEVAISWSPPVGDSCIDAFSYIIVPRGAPEPPAASAPRVQALTVLVQDLRPNTEYLIKVASFNKDKGVGSFAATIVKTLDSCIPAIPGPVGNIYLTSTNTATTWRLTWLSPTSGGCTANYGVDVYDAETNRMVFRAFPNTAEVAIPNLVPGTSYNFRVAARNSVGGGPARRATYTIPSAVVVRRYGKGTVVEYTEKNSVLEPAAAEEEKKAA